MKEEYKQLIHDDGALLFKVTVTVHSAVDFSDQPLTKMIENASSDNDLLALANEDLVKVLGGTGNGRKAGDGIRKQDKLLESRLSRPITVEAPLRKSSISFDYR